jgi:hypothetical protein
MLRDYQTDIATAALEMLRSYKIAYLALEVRTGKTRTALHTADIYGAKKVLFLTKKKAIASIMEDFKALGTRYDLYVSNYESAHKITEAFDLVVLDEAHCMGAYPIPSERAKTVKKLCAGLPIIYLSGTPSPESFSQLYHQFWVSSFSPFAEYRNFYAWAKHFVTIRIKYLYSREINDYSSANKPLIDKHCSHLFISFTQEAAGFTQSVQESVIKVKMKDSTYTLAAKLKARKIFIGRNGEEVLADTAVKLMQKLHQVYSGSVLRDDVREAVIFDDSKARAIKEQFEGQKIAIFYKFKAEYIILCSVFGASAITDSPEEFNRSQDLVFCSQVQSGREGVNLSTADALIMYNIDFSHLSYLQARARMQTRDREEACLLYWIFSEGGIEEKIYEKVKAKEDYQLSHFKKDFVVTEKVQAA